MLLIYLKLFSGFLSHFGNKKKSVFFPKEFELYSAEDNELWKGLIPKASLLGIYTILNLHTRPHMNWLEFTFEALAGATYSPIQHALNILAFFQLFEHISFLCPGLCTCCLKHLYSNFLAFRFQCKRQTFREISPGFIDLISHTFS